MSNHTDLPKLAFLGPVGTYSHQVRALFLLYQEDRSNVIDKNRLRMIDSGQLLNITRKKR